MKVEILMWEKREEEKSKEKEEEIIDLSKVPDLEAPVVRIPKRKVTLEELVRALEKAFRTKELREHRKIRARKRVEEVLGEE